MVTLSLSITGFIGTFIITMSILFYALAVAPGAVTNPAFGPRDDDVELPKGFFMVGINYLSTCPGNPALWPTCPAGSHVATPELGVTARRCYGSDTRQDASDDRPDTQLWTICTRE